MVTIHAIFEILLECMSVIISDVGYETHWSGVLEVYNPHSDIKYFAAQTETRPHTAPPVSRGRDVRLPRKM